jgi:hypothetical protein
MRRTLQWSAALGCALFAAGSPANATLIASETFNYSAGSSLAGQNGGTGWAGAWSAANGGSFGNLTVGAASLNYSGLTSSREATGLGADARNLTGLSNTFGTTVWISLVASLNAGNGGFPNLRLRYNNDTQLAGGIGGNGGISDWSLLDSNLSTASSTPAQTGVALNGATAYVIEKIDYANGTTSMWVDPNLATFDGTQTPSSAAAFAPAFDTIELFGRAGDKFGSIAIGTTLSDVAPVTAAPVPEPSTIAILSGGIALLAYRRRNTARAL